MRLIRVLALAPWLWLCGAGAAPALAATLSAEERSMLTQLLGEDVIGGAVAGSTLTAKYFPLSEGTWTYRIVSGENQGQSEQHVVKALKDDPAGADWLYTVVDTGDVSIDQAGDATLTLLSEKDLAQKVITRYQPGEPGLLIGLAPGDSHTEKVAVEVADLSSPDEVSHTGELDVTYSNLGSYKVTVPAGTYDAVLVKWAYKGKVGPADVDDTQYRFFAEDVGMVATVDKLNVSALFVYHQHTKSGKVLAAVPQ